MSRWWSDAKPAERFVLLVFPVALFLGTVTMITLPPRDAFDTVVLITLFGGPALHTIGVLHGLRRRARLQKVEDAYRRAIAGADQAALPARDQAFLREPGWPPAEAMVELGHLQERLGWLEEARHWYKQAIRAGNPDGHWDLARLMAHEGQQMRGEREHRRLQFER